MFLHPGVIALILGSGIILLLILFASASGIRIISRWDIKSSSEEQLILERKTYLVSTLVQYALLFEAVSAFLFIYTADDMHNILVGAMCATGSLNANPYGFPVLYIKVLSLFVSAAWIAVNYIDNKAQDYPLTRMKYKLLLFILPLVLSEYFLEILFFLGIDPNVITSCCGVLFSEGGPGTASSLAAIPVLPMQITFYSVFLLTATSGIGVIRSGSRLFPVFFSILSGIFFLVSVASIISFVSLYFYQLPSHHCPFDMLQKEYYYTGYPLYLSLFFGSFFGMMTGPIGIFRKIPSLADIVPTVQRKWALISICFITMFVVITLVPMIFLPFSLRGY